MSKKCDAGESSTSRACGPSVIQTPNWTCGDGSGRGSGPRDRLVLEARLALHLDGERRVVAGVVVPRHERVEAVARDVDVPDLVVDRQRVEGKCDLRKRRWDCASMEAITASTGGRRKSIQGEVVWMSRGPGSWNTSRLAICCVQVVPHLGAVAMTMSPARGLNRAQRRLSVVQLRTSFFGALISMRPFPAQ